MDIEYKEAAPLRLTPCLAWLVTYPDGTSDILLTGTDFRDEDPAVGTIRMLRHQEQAQFQISNITVGQGTFEMEEDNPYHQLYFNDARKVDHEGMVQV